MDNVKNADERGPYDCIVSPLFTTVWYINDPRYLERAMNLCKEKEKNEIPPNPEE